MRFNTQRNFSRILIGSAVAFSLSAVAAIADIRFWTTEEQPARLAKQEAMAAAFKAKTGIGVEVIPVTEKDLGTRATAAFAAGILLAFWIGMGMCTMAYCSRLAYPAGEKCSW